MKWIIYLGMCILLSLNVLTYSDNVYDYDNLDILKDPIEDSPNGLGIFRDNLGDPLEESKPKEEESNLYPVGGGAGIRYDEQSREAQMAYDLMRREEAFAKEKRTKIVAYILGGFILCYIAWKKGLNQ